jgi:hypothetical protein
MWTAYREGRFGKSPTPSPGYFFLREDRDNVKTAVNNKKLYFAVDPEFRGEAHQGKKGTVKYKGVTYSKRYELLCRRLVLERLYGSACFLMATNARKTKITKLADDLTFHRFAAALRGHAVSFPGAKPERAAERLQQSGLYVLIAGGHMRRIHILPEAWFEAFAWAHLSDTRAGSDPATRLSERSQQDERTNFPRTTHSLM